MFVLNAADYAELHRLDALGMKWVICDFSGQRGAIDDSGHIELVTAGTLLCVSPTDGKLNIKDALRGRE